MFPCPSDPDASLPDDSTPEGPVIVDSLLTQNADRIRAIRSSDPTGPIILIAHYLHCIDPHEQGSAAAMAERSLLPLFDGVITTSDYARRAIIDLGVSPSSVRTLPPGLDPPYREPVSNAENDYPPQLLTVSNLLPGKGLVGLADALGSLDTPPWRWTIVGDERLDPAVTNELDRQLSTSGMSERVVRTGALSPDRLRTRYDRADLFVLPSQFETCSMAMREALARGLPVVAFDVGGLTENLGDAPAGHLVPVGDWEALTDAVRALLTDPERRARMGRAARRRSMSFPSWTEVGSQGREILQAWSDSSPDSTSSR